MYITCCDNMIIQPYSNVFGFVCFDQCYIHIAGRQKTPISITKHEFLEYIEEQLKSSNAGMLDVTITCTCMSFKPTASLHFTVYSDLVSFK